MTPLPEMGAGLLVRALLHQPASAAQASLHAGHNAPAMDAEHLARYREQLGFAATEVPLSYLYLAAQRAQMATMLQPAFGHRLVGMVHAANTMRWAGDARLDPARPLILRTQVQTEPPREDGAVYLRLGVDFEQDGRAIAHCDSRYLARRATATRAPRPPREKRAATTGATLAEWPLDSSAGRRYAALSGDWNPIHLWPWTARMLGFKRPIIHGMHSAARVEAEFARLAGGPVRALTIEFLRPVSLPGCVQLTGEIASGRFSLAAGDELAARGNCET